MDPLTKLLSGYSHQIAQLAASPSTTEATYYPAIQALLSGVLREARLPFEVRTNTAQRRTGGGADQPDLAICEGASDAVIALGEVKTPREDLHDIAKSTERQDQIGRYLGQTGVVLLSNVRAFGLLVKEPGFKGSGPVPPEYRRLLAEVEIWSSVSALRQGRILAGAAAELSDLLETAVTEFATIAEPESLARVLARLARRAKQGLPMKFSDAVQPLLEDFAKALGIHFEGGEGEEFIRSSLIQTAFYGLFAAWTLWHHEGVKRPFRWEDLGEYLKIPFLGELFHEFRHPLRIRELGLAEHLDRATSVLLRVETERFFSRFVVADVGENRHAPPPSSATSAILYFYEPFLEAFDPVLRKRLGVWYTPYEIVQYQVRNVDRILRDELGCERGFSDERVVVLDPCCGTGAYLIEVLRCIAEQLNEEGSQAVLGTSLLDALCQRIIGFEILTAPFVIAQLQVYLILASLGAEPDESHRPAIFLTNALTGWEGPAQLKLQFPELQREHDAARRIKREEKIIVILGNPPYDRFAGVPVDEETDLVDHYKGIRRDATGRQVGSSELYTRYGIRKQLLNDLYIRFFRLAEVRIGEQADYGVVSWISNSSFLAGRSHPLMRESLLSNFHSIWIDNLHGNRLASERTPWGDSCETVFAENGPGIKVGTCITTLVKGRVALPNRPEARVYVRDFWGRAHSKRRALLTSLGLENLNSKERKRLAELPEGPRRYETVLPTAENRWKLVAAHSIGGYEDWPALDELFPVNFQGINPNRGLDGSVIETDHRTLAARMSDYFSTIPFEDLRKKHPVLVEERARYEPRETRERLQKVSRFRQDRILPYLLFPFDLRFIYYETEGKLLNERRPELWENLAENTFLLTVPQPRRVSESRPLIATSLFDLHLHDRGSVGFPAQVRPAPIPRTLFSMDEPESPEPLANLAPETWEVLKREWHLRGSLSGKDALRLTRQLFFLALALAHAPNFEEDHQSTPAQDWLHLPIPKERALFLEIARLGEELVALLDPRADPTKLLTEILGPARRTLGVVSHCEGAPVREEDLVVTVSYYGAAQGSWMEREPLGDEVTAPALGESTGDLWLNDAIVLRNVPERVWRYELGGYPVIKKWLGYRDAKRRPGRGLTLGELNHLRSIVHRIAALLLRRDRLDAAYERAIVAPFTAADLGLGG